MKTLRFLPLLILLVLAAAPSDAQTFRVLLVGDSWPDFMWEAQSLRTVFAQEGHPELLEKGDVTARSGSTAAEWTQTSWLQDIVDELDANPTIDVVHLTIGGNDFLAGITGGGWYQGIPAQDLEDLFTQIETDVATVVDHILAHDASIEIVFSSYDYTNFVDSLNGGLGIFCTGVWINLGQPTPSQINAAALALEDRLQGLADARSRVRAVRHFGLMQHVFGNLPPGTAVPPGDANAVSPAVSMAAGPDCFHLSDPGYEALALNLWDQAYRELLTSAIFSDGFETGDLSAWSSPFASLAHAHETFLGD